MSGSIERHFFRRHGWGYGVLLGKTPLPHHTYSMLCSSLSLSFSMPSVYRVCLRSPELTAAIRALRGYQQPWSLDDCTVMDAEALVPALPAT
jgi:hypothetical protein